MPFALPNVALSLSVPVAGSIWLSSVDTILGELGARRPVGASTSRVCLAATFASTTQLILGDREDHADRIHARDDGKPLASAA